MKKTLRFHPRFFLLFFLLTLILAACGNDATASSNNGPVTVHLGYFPNITHAVALVGVARGTFQKALGSNQLSTKTFNAGPDLINSLLAGDIDIGYVGPNPAINGYVKSHGEVLRIIAGASSGGALLIVRPEANIKSPADLSGKKIADPQIGGTQDISLRHYLQQHNLKSVDKGGTVQIVATDNSNIVTLFSQGQIDGAWVPEPYASRLILNAHGKVFVDERTLWPNGKFVTTNVVVRKEFLDQHPTIVSEFLQAHVDTVQFINTHLAEAEKLINEQIQKVPGGKALSQKLLDQAFSHLDITYDPLASTLYKAADSAYQLGLLGSDKPDLSHIYSLDALNSVLAAKGLQKVATS